MRANRSTTRKRQFSSTFLVFSFSFLMIVVISSGLALGWQFLMPQKDTAENIHIDKGIEKAPIRITEAENATPVIPPEVISLPPPTTESGKNMEDRAKNEYFDDAAFVGDSITTGIEIYDIMTNADVFAETGLGLYNILDRACIKFGEEKVTIPQALMRTKPKKIYIMLGGNSLGGNAAGGYDASALEAYKKFVETLASQNPQSIIYIQSVLPVNEAKFKEKYKKELTNKNIDAFNVDLKAMSEKNGYHYLDVASVFKNEKGEMPAEYTPDGIHIRSEQYNMWFDFLKENTIK
ncbi:MAG: GDSL-type esterase/lipase family protein [Oscillospiraceae bacterium]